MCFLQNHILAKGRNKRNNRGVKWFQNKNDRIKEVQHG